MDGGMLEHPATQENLALLRRRGAMIIGPEAGHLASGLEAPGRMTEPSVLLGHIRFLLTRVGSLQGCHVVVTAGGTRNRRPGPPSHQPLLRQQGYALAQAALDAGAEVTLISATTSLESPQGAKYLPVCTAAEMETAVLDACRKADALLMSAAVADFRPTQVASHKIKKVSVPPSLNLESTSDILLALSHQREQTNLPRVVIGFAAETDDLLANAAAKLKSKRLDLIVANDVSKPSSGFGVDMNQVTLLYPDGHSEPLPLMKKYEVADRVISEVARLLSK
jgi:phosphopantothenoylcysteine decarboxylase/phosphopantothenate--cysteine ligase